MTLQDPLKRGDWIHATHDSGGEIIGQSTHDMSWGGSAFLIVQISEDTNTTINVNFWKVNILKRNLLPSQK